MSALKTIRCDDDAFRSETISALRYPSVYQETPVKKLLCSHLLLMEFVRIMQKGVLGGEGGEACKLSASKKPVLQACSARDAGNTPSEAQRSPSLHHTWLVN